MCFRLGVIMTLIQKNLIRSANEGVVKRLPYYRSYYFMCHLAVSIILLRIE